MDINLSSLKTLYNNTMDNLISTNGLGSACVFVYEERGTQCYNCNWDPITRRSNGEYNGTGGYPFGYGVMCPICNGVGTVNSEKTETINLAMVFGQKNFLYFGDVGVPQGDMQTISTLETYQQIKTADYIVPSGGNVTQYAQNEFTRVSEPQFISLGDNRYIFTNWQRGA